MGFIKELFIGRKIYLTTDLPKDITKVLISRLLNGWGAT